MAAATSRQPSAVAARSAPNRWAPHALWAAAVVVPFGAYLAWLSQTTLPAGQCTGIGWGCSVAGSDTVGLALVFYGVPLAVLWLLGHLVIAFVQRRRRLPPR